jgi:hypothetical protein
MCNPVLLNQDYLRLMCSIILVSGTIKIGLYGKSQVNKSNLYHYPFDDAEIFGVVMIGVHQNLHMHAHLLVTMAGSGLKSAKKVKVTWSKQTLP